MVYSTRLEFQLRNERIANQRYATPSLKMSRTTGSNYLQIFAALSETLYNQVELVATEKKDLSNNY
jgi:hypothetical protein